MTVLVPSLGCGDRNVLWSSGQDGMEGYSLRIVLLKSSIALLNQL